MKDALVRFFSSMKVWTLLIGFAATIALRYGIQIDEKTQGEFVLLVGLLIAAQGATDHGKAAATINANATAAALVSTGQAQGPANVASTASTTEAPTPSSSSPRAPQAGRVNLSLITVVTSMMGVFTFVAWVGIIGSCGTTKPAVASPSSVALTAAMIATTTAESAFLAYDHDHEINIAKTATSADDANAKLAAYHLKRDKVNVGFAVWFGAVKTASRLRDDHSIEAIAAAALDVGKLIAELKVEGAK